MHTSPTLTSALFYQQSLYFYLAVRYFAHAEKFVSRRYDAHKLVFLRGFEIEPLKAQLAAVFESPRLRLGDGHESIRVESLLDRNNFFFDFAALREFRELIEGYASVYREPVCLCAAQRSHNGSAAELFADIGDEQSIEQSLSTFSSHIVKIIEILKIADTKSLVLTDELGAGTDPTEGAALAIAVIEHARKMGANVAATTHYAELKVYATNENGIQNASCEFDVETLSPTYKLLVGVPGKSNAFAISERLGLSKEIIDDAKARIGVQNASFEATIEKLEQTRALLERDRAETAKKLREAEESAKKAAFLRAELSVRLEKADEKAKRDAERIIAEARQTAENTFAELDEMRRKMNDDEQTQEINHARSELRRKLNESQGKLKAKAPEQPKEEKKSARDVRAGDTVEIKSMGVKAEVIDVNPDGTLNLRAGIMNVKLKPDDVYLIEGHAAKQKKQSVTLAGSTAPRAAVSPEIDLRGMESIEAVNAAEQYIDSAVMGKLKTVTIIHGKGTGALRAAVQQMLKRNKAVKSYRLGRFGEGESGVTIVELK